MRSVTCKYCGFQISLPQLEAHASLRSLLEALFCERCGTVSSYDAEDVEDEPNAGS